MNKLHVLRSYFSATIKWQLDHPVINVSGPLFAVMAVAMGLNILGQFRNVLAAKTSVQGHADRRTKGGHGEAGTMAIFGIGGREQVGGVPGFPIDL